MFLAVPRPHRLSFSMWATRFYFIEKGRHFWRQVGGIERMSHQIPVYVPWLLFMFCIYFTLIKVDLDLGKFHMFGSNDWWPILRPKEERGTRFVDVLTARMMLCSGARAEKEASIF